MMKHKQTLTTVFFGLLLTILTSAVLPQKVQAQSARDWFRAAYDSALQRKFTVALLMYDKALEIRPNYVNAAFSRAWCLRDLGRNKEAIVAFGQVLAIDSTYKDAYTQRGFTYFGSNVTDRAEADYLKAFSIKQDDETTCNYLGLLYEKTGRFPEAKKYYEKALAVNPENKTVQKNLSALLKVMKTDAARAPRQKRKTPQELTLEAYKVDESGQLNEAIALYGKALEQDRNYRPALEYRSVAFSRLKRYDEAMTDLNTCLEISPSAWTYNQRGWVYLKIGKMQTALDDFENALQIDPNYRVAKNNRDWLLKKLSEHETKDTKPPVIQIISPEVSRGIGVRRLDDTVTVIGRAFDENGIEQVLVNGIPARMSANGDFDAVVKIGPGRNKIYAVAFDFRGNKSETHFFVDRPKKKEVKKEDLEAKTFGKNYALLIGNEKYDFWSNLNNPVGDVKAVGRELTDYGFKTEVITNAPKSTVLITLRRYAKMEFGPNDQLFIFFAGHGHFDEVFGEGYVVATDSREEEESFESYISHSQLRTYINNIDCKHIFLTMDVCFGGTFDPVIAARGRGDSKTKLSKMEFISRKMRYKTRRYLTSGGKEYVSDGQPGKHSPFARKLLEAFRSFGGEDGILTVNEIVNYVNGLTPEARSGEFGDNEPGSDFIFLAKED